MMIGSFFAPRTFARSSATLGFSVMMSATIRGRLVGPYFNPLSINFAHSVSCMPLIPSFQRIRSTTSKTTGVTGLR